MFEWKNILRGMAMGASDLIPGVSGGTIALVLGIYHRLIAAINHFFSRKWKEQLGFFIPLGIGIGIALISLSNLLEWLLQTYPGPTYSFFMGLILGTIPILLKEADYKYSFRPYHYVIVAAAAVFIILTGIYSGAESAGQIVHTLTASDYVYLFFAGWLASSAMILPGVSGSFVLLILGAYETIIHALTSLDIPIIITVGFGVLAGITIMSKFLHYLLSVYRTGTYAVMSGFLIGSLFVIFPGLSGSAILLLISIGAFLAGWALTLFLQKLETR
ncbi:putative membrane protein [Alteribacillus persepolensis]|uniref:Putative membrane protein n=1 Tax=Alteribacillus persepolensis TaxID=568899 RepID=A0A1G8G6H8_9BACI|nr:DUF368 domain-containing protein [Alteribacillus persepolensis]SDH89891.1 putative membrane protein [Alteribacillus persepolensis]